MPDVLYHWTCRDSAAKIFNDGRLRPNRHPWLNAPLVWLTDVDWIEGAADVQALGLTRETLACDRTEWRFAVRDLAYVEPWTAWARRNRVGRDVRDRLEEGHEPLRWWVSEHSLLAVSDGTSPVRPNPLAEGTPLPLGCSRRSSRRHWVIASKTPKPGANNSPDRHTETPTQ